MGAYESYSSNSFWRHPVKQKTSTSMASNAASEIFLSRKVQFLGRWYCRVLNDSSLKKIRDTWPGNKGLKTTLKLSARGLKSEWKNWACLGSSHLEFIYFDDIEMLAVDTVYSNVLFCVVQIGFSNDYEVIVYKCQHRIDARTFQDNFLVLKESARIKEAYYGDNWHVTNGATALRATRYNNGNSGIFNNKYATAPVTGSKGVGHAKEREDLRMYDRNAFTAIPIKQKNVKMMNNPYGLYSPPHALYSSSGPSDRARFNPKQKPNNIMTIEKREFIRNGQILADVGCQVEYDPVNVVKMAKNKTLSSEAMEKEINFMAKEIVYLRFLLRMREIHSPHAMRNIPQIIMESKESLADVSNTATDDKSSISTISSNSWVAADINDLKLHSKSSESEDNDRREIIRYQRSYSPNRRPYSPVQNGFSSAVSSAGGTAKDRKERLIREQNAQSLDRNHMATRMYKKNITLAPRPWESTTYLGRPTEDRHSRRSY